ncbi:dihydrodipicolinate synthase family protein [Arthrobacter psychrolactophilus]
MTQPFTGLLAYPITPLANDDELELSSLAHLVRNVSFAGVSGVTVLATSGAGVTFDRGERQAVVQTAVESAMLVGTCEGLRESVMPVYAAVSAPSTREVVRLAQDAERAGATGVLLAPFSYLPLSDTEVRALFLTVSEATALPICFYNKPAQTQYDVSPATLAYLAAHTHVRAVKDTMRRPDVAGRVGELRAAVGPNFSIGLSADVQLLAQLPDVDAWHTGLAGLLPGEYIKVWRLAAAGEPQGDSLTRLQGIAHALASTPHPIGALHALSNIIGVETAPPRGPFAAATLEETWRISAAV